MNKKLTMEDVKKIYEQKYNCNVDPVDLSTPELVLKYIEKYELYSESAEIKLLTTPELVLKYIEKYELYSESAEKLLSTPELVLKYIEKYELCYESARFIFSRKWEIFANADKKEQEMIEKWIKN